MMVKQRKRPKSQARTDFCKNTTGKLKLPTAWSILFRTLLTTWTCYGAVKLIIWLYENFLSDL